MNPELRNSSANESNEPSVGFTPVPVVLFLLLGVLVYFSQLYLDKYGGGFNAKVYQPYDSWKMVQDLQPKDENAVFFSKGRKIFEIGCLQCHQSTGLGSPGAYPPLAGSEWVLAPGPNRIIRIVQHGLQGPIKVKGTDWNLAMPGGIGSSFSDEEIAALITFIRGNKEWGNNATPVTAAQVKAVRDQIADHPNQWTAEELLAIPEK